MLAGVRVTDGTRVGTVSIVDDAAGRAYPTALGWWDDGAAFSLATNRLEVI